MFMAEHVRYLFIKALPARLQHHTLTSYISVESPEVSSKNHMTTADST